MNDYEAERSFSTSPPLPRKSAPVAGYIPPTKRWSHSIQTPSPSPFRFSPAIPSNKTKPPETVEKNKKTQEITYCWKVKKKKPSHLHRTFRTQTDPFSIFSNIPFALKLYSKHKLYFNFCYWLQYIQHSKIVFRIIFLLPIHSHLTVVLTHFTPFIRTKNKQKLLTSFFFIIKLAYSLNLAPTSNS